MKLLTEINNNVKVNKQKGYFIEGVFLQGGIKNRNGRVYPTEVLDNEVNRYVKEYVQQKRALGELGHPEGPTINMERTSHLITELVRDGSNYMGRAKILDTPYGKIVKALIDEEVCLGVSSRGMGSLKESPEGVAEVQDDFYLATAADIVADPSAPDAFVRGIMEGKEWVWDNGVIKEATVASLKKSLQLNRNPEKMAEAFEYFLRDIQKNSRFKV